MLQVVREVESDPTLKIDKALLNGKRELTDEEERDLDNHDISSWDFNNYGGSYSKYCVLTHKFQCENPEFSARNYISRISDDWHPLGFSREKPRVDPCRAPVAEFCTNQTWPAWQRSLLPQFGARAFLMKNVELDSLFGRILIDFGDPRDQAIP
jgi:hypothetical protein